jgi:TPR repeat protein
MKPASSRLLRLGLGSVPRLAPPALRCSTLFAIFASVLVSCGGSTPAAESGDDLGGATTEEEAVCAELSECEGMCNQQQAAGCEVAGRMYETGEGAPQDYSKAATLYDQACEGGREEACAHLAMMYDIGLAVEEDPERANRLYHKACESGNRWACKRGEQLEK